MTYEAENLKTAGINMNQAISKGGEPFFDNC